MLKFELVIPAYNEARNLQAIILRAIEAAQKRGLSASDFNLVVVENGSVDDSTAVLQELQGRDEINRWFRVVRIVKNQGYGFGLWSGLNETKAKWVGWTHADQQCDPDDALKAYLMLKDQGPNLLIKGKRYDRALKDQLVSRTFEFMARIILGIKIHEMNAQPKVFPRHLLGLVRNPPATFAFDLYVLYCALKAGYRVQTIPVRFPPRIHGLSNWASNFFSRYKTILGIVRYMLVLRKVEGKA